PPSSSKQVQRLFMASVGMGSCGCGCSYRPGAPFDTSASSVLRAASSRSKSRCFQCPLASRLWREHARVGPVATVAGLTVLGPAPYLCSAFVHLTFRFGGTGASRAWLREPQPALVRPPVFVAPGAFLYKGLVG